MLQINTVYTCLLLLLLCRCPRNRNIALSVLGQTAMQLHLASRHGPNLTLDATYAAKLRGQCSRSKDNTTELEMVP
jgi:hypothetical protein